MSDYDKNLTEIKRNILAQKIIYRFRSFLYTINKDIRFKYFEICKNYLENEINNTNLTATEKDRLQLLIKHWEWNSFENTSTNWWYILAMNHSHSLSLMTLLHLWVDDVQPFDSEAFETSTDGLR